MTIPKFHAFFLPVLQAVQTNEKTIEELEDFCKKKFILTDDDVNLRIKSGKRILLDRVNWARTYLKRAGLVYYPRRGVTAITDIGDEALKTNKNIDINFLNTFDTFLEFQNKNENDSQTDIQDINSDNPPISPEETIEKELELINRDLKAELKNEVLKINHFQFEQLVVDLILKMGYGFNPKSGHVTKKTGDGGFDGVIRADVLGLNEIYIEAKQYNESTMVGDDKIRSFIGAMDTNKIDKGIFITTNRFTEPAKDTVKRNSKTIILIDGNRLIDLMFDYNLGVQNNKTIVYKKIDYDYFDNID